MSTMERQPIPSDSREGEPCAGHPVLERIATRGAEVGGLPIHRAIPNRQRRMVGAWCFLDHAGPISHAAGRGLHVGPHPHIGLQTFTWMIEGEVVHRDSLGYEQVKAERFRPPAFQHHAALPSVSEGGFRMTVLAGSAFGACRPRFIRPSSDSTWQPLARPTPAFHSSRASSTPLWC